MIAYPQFTFYMVCPVDVFDSSFESLFLLVFKIKQLVCSEHSPNYEQAGLMVVWLGLRHVWILCDVSE
jgi:hypothetical protein